MEQNTVNIKNRKASFDYSFIEKFIAGLVLTGTEIKAIRLGKATIAESFCLLIKDEVYVRNMNVQEYANSGYAAHPPVRDRKLLLKKKEINRIAEKLKEQGISLIPLRIYISEKGFAKVEIALAKGKKTFDKRDDIKRRDLERETNRKFK
jgi:SsrA-binding protein